MRSALGDIAVGSSHAIRISRPRRGASLTCVIAFGWDALSVHVSSSSRRTKKAVFKPAAASSLRWLPRLEPNDFQSLNELEQRLLAFQRRYEETASPFQWTFTRKDLATLLTKIENKRFAPAA
jgi:hypothetical protein